MNITQKIFSATTGLTLMTLIITGCGGGGGGGGGVVPAAPAPAISALVAGGAANCRIATSNSGTVCWGQNDVGQLGIGTTSTTATPTIVTYPGGKTAKRIAAGVEHSCAVQSDDTLACWGDNTAGQLGLDPGITAQANAPVTVPGLTGVAGVAVGLAHTCIVTTANAVQCWGSNTKGQLGQAPAGLVQIHQPQTITGLAAKSVSSGFNQVCALKTDDTVACWGDNQYGQLGRGDNTDSPIPVVASGLSQVKSLSSGANHVCAVTSAKTYCWGRNNAGQLGSNGTNDRNSPTETQGVLGGVIELAGGQAHSCALTASAVECWGSNANKQLSGNTAGGNARVIVPMSATPKRVTAGVSHTCVQDGNNETWCWGAGSLSRLGPNASSDSATPVKVP